jgi:fructoselysine 6-kinase
VAVIRAVSLGDNCIDRYLEPVRREHVGGQALNVAANLRGLGIQAAYAGVVGIDRNGDTIRAALIERGVDVSLLERATGATGVTEVVVQDGERTFLSEDYGVSAPYAPSPQAIESASSATLVFAAHLTDLGEFARALGPGPVLGVDLSVGRPEGPVPERVDVVFVSRPGSTREQAVGVLTTLARRGAQVVVVTRGAAGALALRGDDLHEAEAVPTEVVDTLGAGDAFAAAFLHSLLEDRDLDRALARGSEAGAAACRHFGALAPSPSAA